MRIWFDPLRLLRSSPASSARRRLVRRGNQWLLRLSLSATYRPPPPFRRKAILIILQSITPGMTRIIHRAGVGVTHGAGDGLSEFPLDFADAGTAGSAAALSDQGSDASVLRMRVLVAVSAGAVADSMITPAAFRSDRQVKRSRVARSGADPVVGTPPPFRAGAAERVLELNAAFERSSRGRARPWVAASAGSSRPKGSSGGSNLWAAPRYRPRSALWGQSPAPTSAPMCQRAAARPWSSPPTAAASPRSRNARLAAADPELDPPRAARQLLSRRGNPCRALRRGDARLYRPPRRRPLSQASRPLAGGTSARARRFPTFNTSR